MRNLGRDRTPIQHDPGADLHRYVWGHPVRHLEMHAWNWLERALTRYPQKHAQVCGLMRRLEEATAPLTVPDSAAVGWVGEQHVDHDTVSTLEKVVAVMRDLERLLDDSPRPS